MVRNIRNIIHQSKESMIVAASPLDQIDFLDLFKKQLDTTPEPAIAMLNELQDHFKSPSNQRWFVTGSQANLSKNASLLAELSGSELAKNTTRLMDNSPEINKGSWVVKMPATESSFSEFSCSGPSYFDQDF